MRIVDIHYYTQITMDGKVYKACPKELVEAFSTYVDENSDIYYYDYESMIFIVDEDMPVLLNSIFGDYADTYNDTIIQIECSISKDELDSAKAQVFQNYGVIYTDHILENETSYYSFRSYYIAEEVYDQIINSATNYKETHFGTYNEDKSEVDFNGTTYIKAPEDLHKKYDDYNKSIFDVIDYDDEYDCIYVNSLNDLSPSTMYEIHNDGEILYSYTWDWDSDNIETIDDTYYHYYNEEDLEYYYYVYYFREDVYDELENELMK